MVYVPTEQLLPNMILARDLNLPNLNPYGLRLLAKGERLKDIYISKIMQFGFPGVYVESEVDHDIPFQFHFEEQIRKTSEDVKNVFEKYKENNFNFDKPSMEKVGNIAVDLVQNVQSTQDCTINLIDLKYYDGYTYQHSLSVAILSILTGITLRFTHDQLKELATSALLHDIGKMVIPLEIINKPGRLTDVEFNIVKQHPLNAVKHLTRKNLVSSTILCGVENHHEKFDGTGYPNGRKGDSIPLFARILAVSDVYDALTSDRPYRKKWSPSDAIEYIMGYVDSHFDHAIVTAFLRSAVVYPVGACVSLSNGLCAIVFENVHENVLRPVIKLLHEDGTLGRQVNMLESHEFENVTILDFTPSINKTGFVKFAKAD